jgi:hypothetical protein
MGAGERSELTEARRVKSWTMLFVPRRSEFRVMVSGFDSVLVDSVLFWFCVR